MRHKVSKNIVPVQGLKRVFLCESARLSAKCMSVRNAGIRRADIRGIGYRWPVILVRDSRVSMAIGSGMAAIGGIRG